MSLKQLSKTKITLLFLFFCICLYLIFVSFSIHQITVADEIVHLNAAKIIAKGGIPLNLDNKLFLIHPPLYLYSLAFVGRFLGVNSESMRLVGILSFIMTLFLIYGISKEVTKSKANGYLVGLGAAFLYAINPLAIRGSLLSDLDTTLMTVTLLLFIYFFLKFYPLLTFGRLIFLSILFTLSLWSKLPTNIILILSIFLFYFLKKEFKRGIGYASIILILGGGLFLLSWGLYCNLNGITYFFTPFIYLKESFLYLCFQGEIIHNMITVVRAIWKLILWLTPFFLILGVASIGSRIKFCWRKRRFSEIDFLIIYTILVFGGYLITGRGGYGFPKYHFPIISTLSILISFFVFKENIGFRKKDIIIYSVLVAILVFYNIWLVGDLLYSTDYLLKEALITGNTSPYSILLKGCFKFLIYLFPLSILFFVGRLYRREFSLLKILTISLLITTISASLSLDILQAKADYLTAYYYGGRGTNEVINFIKTHVDVDGLILAPPETIYYSNNRNYSYYFLRDALKKMDPAEFIKAMSDEKVVCVVYGICSQTVDHFNKILNILPVQRMLQDRFYRKDIGSYTIWLRKESQRRTGYDPRE